MPYYSYNIIKDLYYNSYEYPQPDNPATHEKIILEKYIKDDKSGIELPDILTNINGSHIYKLISSKDIDLDNAFLPNSTVSNKNWGSFDSSRRWNDDTPIYINDVYELMNVIDYLLCSCADLWSEINKLKYGGGNEIELWFLKDTTEILKSSALVSADLRRGNTKNIPTTILNPKEYFINLNISDLAIGTQFYCLNEDKPRYPIRRLLVKKGNKNGIQGITNENQINYHEDKVQSTAFEGQVVSIYAYKINNGENQIKFFPGFNFDNYINSNKVYKGEDVVNLSTQKVKYNNIFFRLDKTKNEYKRVYCEFLTIQQNIGYILYYKDSNEINQIIYISDNIKSTFLNNISNYNEYIFNSNNWLGGHTYKEDDIDYPYLFICDDEFSVDLNIETPTIENKFEKTDKTITLYYYKANNDITVKIYSDNEDIVFNKVEDTSQATSFLVNKERYNIPDNKDINFKITADWINYNSEIKYDDEYMDYPVFPNDEIDDATEYYTFNQVNNNGQREFQQFNSEQSLREFANNIGNQFNDVNSNSVVQLYKKINEPYKLSYQFVTNQFILQDVDYDIVKQQVEEINSKSRLYLEGENDDKSYILTINHILPDDYEQIKFNLNLEISETSKVKGVSQTLPINLNKVHNPKLHYINWQDTKQEYDSYFNFNVYYLNNNERELLSNLSTMSSFIHDSKMYELLYKYSINSYMINGIYNEDPENNSEFTNEQLESNDNNIITISYHPIKSIVNLLGSNMTCTYLYPKYKNKLPIQSFETFINSYISEITNLDGDSIYKYISNDSGFELINQKAQSIFNIYNLGKNYRFKANNDLYTHPLNTTNIWENNYNYNINANSSNRKSNNQNYEDDIITYFLNYKIEINNNLPATKTYYLGNIQYINTGDYFDNDIYHIKTNLFDIYKTTYLSNTFETGRQSIFVPVAYMNITNSTFYPPSSVLPDNTNHKYDLSINVDKQKYFNYVNSWGNETNIGTVDLKLKLQENLNKGVPFFKETNEVMMRFNIKRCTDFETTIKQPSSIRGKEVKILINKKYYLSDLIDIILDSEDKYNTCSIGSYPQWNEENQRYDIIEINSQSINNIRDNNNSIYNYINYIDDYTKYIDISNIPTILRPFLPDISQYEIIYNFGKIAEVNKLKINDNFPRIDGHDNTNNKYFEYNDLNIFTLKLDNIGDLLTWNYNPSEGHDELNPIVLDIKIDKIFGNLQYSSLENFLQTPNVNITPIYRKKEQDDVTDQIIFPEFTLNDITIQLLNFDEDQTYYYKNGQEYLEIEKPEITQLTDLEQLPDDIKEYKNNIINYFEQHNLYINI